MIEKGFKPLGNTTGEYQPGKKGIDGIYAHPNPPPDYVITEAKYNKAQLGKTVDGRQMSDGSVEKYLIRTKPDGSMSTRTLNGKGYVSGTPNGF